MVKDTRRLGGLDPTGLVAVGGRLFFFGSDREHGEELWMSDGTAAGTRLVQEILPGKRSTFLRFADGSSPMVAHGGKVFFSARDGDHGWEPWVSDGTPAGTHLLKDLAPTDGSYPRLWTAVGDRLFFVANGTQLWVTDGTSGGTRLVRTMPYATVDRSDRMAALDGRLYLGGRRRLWVSDGSAQGTRVVRDFGRQPFDEPLRDLTAIGDRLWLSASTAAHGPELWVSDGSTRGTRMVKDLRLGRRGSAPGPFVRLGDRVVFTAEASDGLPALWRSDGSADGTRRLPTPRLPDFSDLSELTRFNRWVMFAAHRTPWIDGDHLWRTDGTAAGTERVAKIWPTEFLSGYEFTVVGDVLFFVSNQPGRGAELWRTDGTRDGTRIVKDLR